MKKHNSNSYQKTYIKINEKDKKYIIKILKNVIFSQMVKICIVYKIYKLIRQSKI